MGNTEPLRQAETGRAFKRRVCGNLRTTSTEETKPQEVRIMQLQPAIDCSLMWATLHNVILPPGARLASYMVIHDIYTRMWGCIGLDWWTRETVAVREVRHHITSTHRTRGEAGDLGVHPNMDSSGSKDGPMTYTQGMAPSSLFQTLAQTKTSGDLEVFAPTFFMPWINAGPGLHRLHASDTAECISGQK